MVKAATDTAGTVRPMVANDEPSATGFSPDEIAAIVYEARASGKTVMAHAQATQGIKNAVLGGIDSIEHAIRQSAKPAAGPIDDAGYLVGYAIAEDNLRLGRTVVADCVNPWPLTRDAWVSVARRAGVSPSGSG